MTAADASNLETNEHLAHGLKHTLVPVATAFVPGLPTSFSVVLYFLLETRQTHEKMDGGGTLLPLHSTVRAGARREEAALDPLAQ